ncbi:16S rRNA (uracil(1498)-N(3))-methyltransferase [Solimonas marina]|uniref:Ribosomal RNA small subunit methyltransferase E n=1 Tax=Solimonas marina TaxID=2714601 RepID=A0A969W7Z3_9GAMM|nr:16S rRNA (uracil(1498)-N(3))-methyltransferase [Solimonas marina]NKF22376.1 16S rRNA (uracil(1498)-N(3))-methyltransferase [Solimonas marina]
MAAPRIYFEHLALADDATVRLPDTAFRHLIQVLRLRPGENFVAFDGSGREYPAELVDVGKREAVARLGPAIDVDRESPLDLTLAQCVSKGDRMDYTLQKAVELGVTRIVPLLSQRSVVKLDAERWEKKLEHWRGVIVSACEQSGRTRMPALAAIAPLPGWLDTRDRAGLAVTLDPLAAQGLRSLSPPNGPLTLLVGPEGGLDDAELRRAHAGGFTGIRMGPRVLRTETAGVAALAALQALWGDWD